MPASNTMRFTEEQPLLREMIDELPRDQRVVFHYMIRNAEWVVNAQALVFSNKTTISMALAPMGYDYGMISRALHALEDQGLIVPLVEKNPLRWRVL